MNVFHKVVDKVTMEPHKLDLDYFASDNFIGLFLFEEGEKFLKKIVTELAEEAKKIGKSLCLFVSFDFFSL